MMQAKKTVKTYTIFILKLILTLGKISKYLGKLNITVIIFSHTTWSLFFSKIVEKDLRLKFLRGNSMLRINIECPTMKPVSLFIVS